MISHVTSARNSVKAKSVKILSEKIIQNFIEWDKSGYHWGDTQRTKQLKQMMIGMDRVNRVEFKNLAPSCKASTVD